MSEGYRTPGDIGSDQGDERDGDPIDAEIGDPPDDETDLEEGGLLIRRGREVAFRMDGGEGLAIGGDLPSGLVAAGQDLSERLTDEEFLRELGGLNRAASEHMLLAGNDMIAFGTAY